jgi:prophage regulatory protein
METFIRVKEVARILSIGKSTVWLWVKQQRLPQPIHLSARVSVWKASDINNYIASASQQAA